MENRLALVLIVLSCLVLSGCWDRSELPDIAVVGALGLERTEEGLRITAQLLKPIQPGGTEAGPTEADETFVTLSGEGRTVDECLERVGDQLSRRLYLGHLQLVVVHEDLAREGIDWYDYFSRDTKLPFATSIALTSDSTQEFLKVPFPEENVPSFGLKELLKSVRPPFLQERLEFERRLLSARGSVLLPVVKIAQGEAAQFISPEGLGVIQEGRLTKVLGLELAKTITMVADPTRLARVRMTAPCPTQAAKHFSFRLDHVKSSFFLQDYDGSQLTFQWQGEWNTPLVETHCAESLSTPSGREEYTGGVQRRLVNLSREAWQETAGKRVDAFELGRLLRHSHPRVWQRVAEDWETQLSNARLLVHHTVHIVDTRAAHRSPAEVIRGGRRDQ